MNSQVRGIRLLEQAQKNHLIGLLELACESLDITDAERRMAEGRYDTVADWLATGPNSFLSNSTIYTQGSIRLHTAVRPIGRNEFDVDLICHIPNGSSLRPQVVRDLVGDRLRDHGTYRTMLEPLKRGWRLTYANEFHMDITPSVPDVQHASGGILVPDRELQDWKESHPKGYAGWFEKIAAREPATLAVEARADVERLPAELPFKGSLRRIVQIMKRHRDVWRAKQPVEQRDDAPISIIITTLAAKAYEKALKGFYLNALDLLLDVTDTMPSFIEVQWNESGMPDLWVRNPCNDKENFADKWHANPQRAEAFHNWHNAFKSDLDKLAQEPGIDAVARGLGELMDESVSKSVMAEHMKRMNAKRASLGVSASASGLLITPSGAAKAVPLNTFYGR